MKRITISLLIAMLMSVLSVNTFAADYIVDTQGAHASINFKIQHGGFSWLTGRFNTFDGIFSYDKDDIEASSVQINVDTASIDSNHDKRDNHLRSADFLNVSQHPKATFVSKQFVAKGEGQLDVIGDLTLNGVTKEITIDAERIAEGDKKDKYIAGFAGTTELVLKDFNIKKDLGPASRSVFMELHIEGIHKK